MFTLLSHAAIYPSLTKLSNSVLSDPAICSRTETYGPTDLGPLGINMFFAQHECNCFCYSFLLKPQQPWFGIFA